jgi:hypothetical protein
LVIVGEDEQIVLNCYRLARFYRCDPRVFLAMPLFSELSAHWYYTCRLAEQERQNNSDDD